MRSFKTCRKYWHYFTFSPSSRKSIKIFLVTNERLSARISQPAGQHGIFNIPVWNTARYKFRGRVATVQPRIAIYPRMENGSKANETVVERCPMDVKNERTVCHDSSPSAYSSQSSWKWYMLLVKDDTPSAICSLAQIYPVMHPISIRLPIVRFHDLLGILVQDRAALFQTFAENIPGIFRDV